MTVKQIDDGGNAFPIPGLQDDSKFNGLSVRDWFAGKAMQGELSASTSTGGNFGLKLDIADNLLAANAKHWYRIADAMIAERAPLVVESPNANPEGWIDWTGGVNPVPGQVIKVELRNGHIRNYGEVSGNLRWDHTTLGEPHHGNDIVRYRVVGSAA
ncbi:MAG: hypothetical protein ACRYGK_17000 [Janthinobacterium lividum]